MAFIPHTEADVQAMLSSIGAKSLNDLFDEVPENLRYDKTLNVPDALDELALAQHMQSRAMQDEGYACYLGAGSYEHFIPAAVWELVSRGEILTAYTPYQAEASQGGLQIIYEYQTMMASLTGMAVSNASVYDGATALTESLLMAVRDNKHCKAKRVCVAANMHPYYRATVKTILAQQDIEVLEIPFNETTGCIDATSLSSIESAAFAIQQPNFFGALESVDILTDEAHQNNMLMIGCVNPMTLALLKPPGEWGEAGADIACGDGQPLGIPMASGGPYFGFMTCRENLVRQLPGRIVGRTVDLEGKPGFTLTLQAREQHIRRGKAKSNICTNQGLLVTAATIYMSLMGFQGLRKVANQCVNKAHQLADALSALPGVKLQFDSAFFHEFVLQLPQSANGVLKVMRKEKCLAGLDLKPYFGFDNSLLVCVTETKTEADIEHFITLLKRALEAA